MWLLNLKLILSCVKLIFVFKFQQPIPTLASSFSGYTIYPCQDINIVTLMKKRLGEQLLNSGVEGLRGRGRCGCSQFVSSLFSNSAVLVPGPIVLTHCHYSLQINTNCISVPAGIWTWSSKPWECAGWGPWSSQLLWVFSFLFNKFHKLVLFWHIWS